MKLEKVLQILVQQGCYDFQMINIEDRGIFLKIMNKVTRTQKEFHTNFDNFDLLANTVSEYFVDYFDKGDE